ncbi:Mov34-domain-containing protein [Tilletiaria anomala UBC 951]|uniref:Mov34-domain-containing protein n=1 Tax=Tilletiaria anomala (strain ATCC 24038 / CBS 436.72 / UBC 951) TaxID=1037660 RepID=A0A066VNC8_TILAU|nr:Mov34-domain-containing protein [Tilletiaria anomala UBC 951]KDN40264.1 Mov34-domain-containing protein [Tilletiaria anomala UBC 951]
MPATTAETTQLASTTVIVHPLVLLSVTDHAARSASGARKRVVGVLLGQDNGKVVNVANSFAVPFEEDDKDPKTWYLDHDYIQAMNDMYKKVNAREKMIGWYHTGPRLRASDLEINELMRRFIPRPVMVIVDPRQRDVGIPTDAYFAVEEIKDDGTATQRTFMHVPSEIQAEEAEEIGVEQLLRDIRDTTTVGTLSTRVSSRLASLRGLQSRLVEIRDYLSSVVKGELPVNHQIIYDLQDIFNLLPDLDKSDISRSFSIANNDQLLVVYLSSLIRSVIALHGLVNNRMENARGEDEEVDGDSASGTDKDVGAKEKDGAGKVRDAKAGAKDGKEDSGKKA